MNKKENETKIHREETSKRIMELGKKLERTKTKDIQGKNR